MCISDNPPTYCDHTCGHLDFPNPEALLSALETLPKLTLVPPDTDIGEGRLYEQDALFKLIESASSSAVDLATSDPDPEELEDSADMQELALTERPAPGALSVRELVAYLYPSGKEPRYCLTIKSPSKNAMVWQPNLQCRSHRVKVGVLDHNQKSVKLNCRLFLRIRLFYSTSPVREIENSTVHPATEVFEGRLSRIFAGDEDEIVFDGLKVVNGTLKFPNGNMFLVVECTNLPTIRQAIAENIKIRKEDIS